jgi:hypothetical protein
VVKVLYLCSPVICDAICVCVSYLQYQNSNHSDESRRKMDSPKLQQKKGLGAIASSLNYIGGTIGNALEVSICGSFFPNTIEFLMFHIFSYNGQSSCY